VAIDVGVDLSTPAGELVAGVMGSVSQFERRLIGIRTREAFAVRRQQGVRLSSPRRCPDDVLARVVTRRAAGARLADVAAELNANNVLTPGGGARWWPSHVSRLLKTQDADTLQRGRLEEQEG
jgi:DNA invertase Pin-like site-specific DNA recombinase